MDCLRCGADPCTCRTAVHTQPYTPRPVYDFSQAISRDQFGHALWDCLVAFGRREQIQALLKLHATDGRHQTPEARRQKLDGLRAELTACDAECVRLLPALTPDEQRQVMQRFESDHAAR